MKRRILLISPTIEECSTLLKSLESFINEKDTVVLALAESSEYSEFALNAFPPYKLYNMGWASLNNPKLTTMISRFSHQKKRSACQLINQSQYLDIVYCPISLFKDSNKNSGLNTLLNQLKCPLFLFDEGLSSQEKVYLKFDGLSESFDAIRVFSYLFIQRIKGSQIHLLIKANIASVEAESCIYEFIRAKWKNFSMSHYFDVDSKGENYFALDSKEGIWVEAANKELDINELINKPPLIRPFSMFLA